MLGETQLVGEKVGMKNMNRVLESLAATAILIGIGLLGLTWGQSLRPEVEAGMAAHALFEPALGCVLAGVVLFALVRGLASARTHR